MKNKSNHSKKALREIGLFILDILYNAVVIIALVVLIRSFLISPFRVIGSSMANTLENNEFILIDKLSYHLSEPQRGDPIVFLPPITNKQSYKYKQTVTTNDEGLAIINVKSLDTVKTSFFCRNKWVGQLWLCAEKIEEGDLAYFHPSMEGRGVQINWEGVTKKVLNKKEANEGKLVIKGLPNKEYLVRIYNSTGPEYYVKRVIGIPGDSVKIENGRVYIKPFNEKDFKEADEFYLNQENKGNTYFREIPDLPEIKVPTGEYFVMGDNRNHSSDSRHWFSPLDEKYSPFVKEQDISGKVLIVLWPPQDLRLIHGAALEEL